MVSGDYVPYRSPHLSSISSADFPQDDDLAPHEHDLLHDTRTLSSMDPAINELKQDMLDKSAEKKASKVGEKASPNFVVGAGGDLNFSPKRNISDQDDLEFPAKTDKMSHDDVKMQSDKIKEKAIDLLIGGDGGSKAVEDEVHDGGDDIEADEVFADDKNDSEDEEEINDDDSEDEETALKKVDLTDLTPSLNLKDDEDQGDVDKLEQLIGSAAAGLLGIRSDDEEEEEDDDESDENKDEQCLLQSEEPVEVSAVGI